MAILEFNVNGKVIKVSDEVDDKETGIDLQLQNKEEEIKDNKEYEDTVLNVFGDENEK